MSSSEERKDQFGADLVANDYSLHERLGELEEWEKLDPSQLAHWEHQYRKAEKALLASLGSRETVEYLQAKSRLMSDHSKNIS